MACSEDSVPGCELGDVHPLHISPGVLSEGTDAQGQSDAASTTKGHSLDETSQKGEWQEFSQP